MCLIHSALVEDSEETQLVAKRGRSIAMTSDGVGGAGTDPQIISHIEGTFRHCSYQQVGISASKVIVIDGSSHSVIKSSVSNLKLRGREKMMPLLGHDASFSQSIA